MDERERVLLTLAGVRAFMGVFWLVNLLWKLPTDFGKGEYLGLPRTLDVGEGHAFTPLLRSLVDDVLIPHISVLGWVLFIAGLATGLSLLLGYMTRVGAALGLVQAISVTLPSRMRPASGCTATSCSSCSRRCCCSCPSRAA